MNTNTETKVVTKSVPSKRAPSKPAKSAAKPATKPVPAAAATAVADAGFTVADLARDFKTSAYLLRRALREIGAMRPGGRWVWKNRAAVGAATIAKLGEWFGTSPSAKTTAKKAGA